MVVHVHVPLLVALAVAAAEKDTQSWAVPTAKLRNGIEYPLLGLGCASGVRKQHVVTALDLGYRLIDTAQAYHWGYHEHEVGEAIAESSVPRDEIFLQTKLMPRYLGYESTKKAIQRSLDNLKVDYLDSLLIHFPHCHHCQTPPEGTWMDSWRAMEEAHSDNRIKAIGVSNFGVHLLRELWEKSSVKPMIVQNWMDPFHQDEDTRRFCQEHDTLFQGYSQFGTQWRYRRAGIEGLPVLSNEMVQKVAQAHNVSTSQVVIRWMTGLGVSAIPASTKRNHQKMNLDAMHFDLTPTDLKTLAALDGFVPGKPKEEDHSVNAVFSNKLEEGLGLYWVGHDGQEVLQKELEAGDSIRISTYPGHVFTARMKNGEEEWRFEMRPEPKEQVFDIATKTSRDDL
mmetsp:Transcript_6120/g.11516  ORF Transcript_6120/g.11516 Transcript_6120/m.11516 type:complete len:396 (+) Transcript_6120:16-1203(+)